MVQKEFKQRKQIHLKGFNYSSNEDVFFLTICTADKQPYFSDPNISRAIVDELEYRRASKEIKLFCYCIMPDHLHMLISLEENYTKKKGAFGERTLQNWVSAFKRHTARISAQISNIRRLWQSNFYDHVLRREESLVEICSYILNNPVRRGIVLSWEEYPYSKMVDDLPI
jgi:REP element-mobilizing transposase RayT